MSTELPRPEFDDRLAAVRERITEAEVDAGVWFGATSIEYLTGFAHIQTERPVLLAVTSDTVAITVPRLELDRAEAVPTVDRVDTYHDYPAGRPVETAVRTLSELDVESVTADADGAPGVMGYQGPALSRYLEVGSQNWVDRVRWAKSDAEIGLIRESARWANLGHRYLADHTDPAPTRRR